MPIECITSVGYNVMADSWARNFSTLASGQLGDRLANALAKLSEGVELTTLELDAIRLAGNRTEKNNSLLEGLLNGTVYPSFAVNVVANEQPGFNIGLVSDTQAIPNEDWTLIENNTLVFQDAKFVDLDIDGTLVSIQQAGVYDIFVSAAFADNAVGVRLIRLNRNSVGGFIFDTRSAAVTSRLWGTFPIFFNKGEELAIEVWQNSGDALNLTFFTWHMQRILSPKSGVQ